MGKGIFGKMFFGSKSDDVIIPYDGDDAVYAVGDFSDDAELYIDTKESDREFKKSFIDVLRSKVKKPEPPQEQDIYDDVNELDSDAEAAFDYFRGISKKIETLKKSVTDVVKRSDNKSVSDAYIKEVTQRLEEINAMLDRRVAELSAGAEAAGGKYDEIFRGLNTVAKSTEENTGKISELSGVVEAVSHRVDEIHTTTNSIDKLYDSVFEFKNSIYAMKQELETFSARQKKTSTAVIVLVAVNALFAVSGTVLAILSLVL